MRDCGAHFKVHLLGSWQKASVQLLPGAAQGLGAGFPTAEERVRGQVREREIERER